MLLAIDPGKQVGGYAIFDETGTLIEAGVLRFKDSEEEAATLGHGFACQVTTLGYASTWKRVMIERMELRRQKLEAVNDIIRLTELSGIFAGAFRATCGIEDNLGAPEISYIEANRWTQGRDKAQNHPRIVARLRRDGELTAMHDALRGLAKQNHKEVLDAIGIGLWTLRRL